MLQFRLGVFTLVCIGLLLVGCDAGSAGRVPVFKVTGKITMSGAAVANANVFFSPKGSQPVAIGRTGTDGQFVLTTYDAGDGAAEGDYVVLVSKEAPANTAAGPPSGHDAAKAFDGKESHGAQKKTAAGGGGGGLLPEKYSKADKSDLMASVKASGPNEINLDLKP